MNKIIKLKWKDIEKLNKEKTCLFVTAAPVEEHGLHLPVSIDIDLGKYWEESTVLKLQNRYPDYNFLSLPTIPLASGSMKSFPGCIYIKPKTLRKVMTEYLGSIARWGIKYLVIIASHGDPLHNMAIEKACRITNRRFGTSFISPMGSMFSYSELGIDLEFSQEVKNMLQEYPEDFHAGWIETSLMLEINPEKVSPKFKNAEDVIVREKEMINPKIYIARTAGKGHLGFPRFADAKLGRMLNVSTVNFIVKVTEKLLNNEDIKRYSRHFLNRIPFLRLMV